MKTSAIALALITMLAFANTPVLRAAEPSEVSTLRQAYKTLAIADHDYKGHRAKAMRQIEAACDLLGSDIRGDGKGHEKQPISDAQLREAQQMVEHARKSTADRHQAVIARHLEEATNEIAIALTIK